MILQGKNIFLLEDDRLSYAVILAILRHHGAHVTHDYWGDTTLTRLKNQAESLDLILLDLVLPGQTTGYDVFNAIRILPHLDRVAVVAVSAADPALEIPRAKARGFSGFIRKPIDRQKFPELLARIMNGETYWG